MDKTIWDIIASIGIKFHPERIDVIADKLSGISSVNEFSIAKSGFGPVPDKSIIEAFENTWRRNPKISPLEIVAALYSASKTANIVEKRETVEMVWTGPFTGLVASRHTEQVLMELIDDSKETLFLVSFVAYKIDSIIEALRNAICRNVKIEILLESSHAHGGKIDFDSIEMLKKALPSVNVYSWNSESKSSEILNGVVHAKCAVADCSRAFITSANLTRAAMENNMELGVLIHGGSIPEKLARHLEALIITGVIEKV